MNCKPGDLAIIVGLDAGTASNTLPNDHGIASDFRLTVVDMRGTIFKCIKSFLDEDGDIGWEVEPREVRHRAILSDGRPIIATGTITIVPDRVLHPLRGGDLGEDVFTTEELPSDNLILNNEQ